MKQSLLTKYFCVICAFCFVAIQAQNNYKLPKNTVFYMEVNGKVLNSKINWAKLNPAFQDILKKKDSVNIWNDFSNTGIKYDQKQIHYFEYSDSLKSYNAHFTLQDDARFENFINSAKKKGLEITKKNNYSYVSLDESTFIAWNKKNAVLKILDYEKPYNYDDYTVVDSAAVISDSVAAVPAYPEMEENPMEEQAENAAFDYKEEIKYLEEDIEYYTENIKSNKETIERIKKDIAYLKKHHQYPKVKDDENTVRKEENEMEESDSEEKMRSNPDEIYSPSGNSDLAYNLEMDSIKLANYKMIKGFAEASFEKIFNSNFIIEVPLAKTQFKDEKSDLFAFTNFSPIFGKNNSFANIGSFGIFQNYLTKMYDSDTFYNLYFENDQVKMINNYKNSDPQIQKSIGEWYNGKSTRKLSKLFSDKSIGYFSMNLNGYKSFDVTYDLVNKMVENEKYEKEISLFVETMKIVLDEKAISEIAPGNAVFILNDVSYKKVEYTDYEYDEEYNEKEITKTKDTAIPNFTFAFLTENEGYWNRVFQMISASKETQEQVKKEGDHFILKSKNNTEIEEFIFGVKDGIVYITTAAENLNRKSQSATSKKWAKESTKYSFSGRMDLQKLSTGLEKEFKDKKESDLYQLFRKNAGEISYKTEVKSDNLQSEFTYEIKNSSENSLMYFFDLFDDIYKIMEPNVPTKL